MKESTLPAGLSADELAESLGELLSDDEMEKVVGGTKEFSLAETLV